MLPRARLASPSATRLFQQQKRTFIPPSSVLSALSSLNSYGKPLHFHANRTLQYPRTTLFEIISDIASYPAFIPGLQDARILARAKPRDSTSRELPALASLTIGAGPVAKWGLSKTSPCFVSHVYCSPERGVVEAVAGEEQGSKAFTEEELVEAGYRGDLVRSAAGVQDMGPDLFQVCRTKWSLMDVGLGRTEVDLRIEIHWKNALLATATQAAAPSMAENVIAAFEKRAREMQSWK